MDSLIRWQLAGAVVGLALTLVSFLMAAVMKRWVHLPITVPSAVRWHRFSAWGSLGICLAISFTCLKYHFPLSDPLSALDFGWFAIHPINGAVGLLLYPAKLLVVRGWKKGWQVHGMILGCALLIFWLIQAGTVAPSLFP